MEQLCDLGADSRVQIVHLVTFVAPGERRTRARVVKVLVEQGFRDRADGRHGLRGPAPGPHCRSVLRKRLTEQLSERTARARLGQKPWHGSPPRPLAKQTHSLMMRIPSEVWVKFAQMLNKSDEVH